MKQIGEIVISGEASAYAAMEKIRGVCISLSFSRFTAARLATLTAKLAQSLRNHNTPVRLDVNVEKQRSHDYLLLTFRGKGHLQARDIKRLTPLCESLNVSRLNRSEKTVEIKEKFKSDACFNRSNIAKAKNIIKRDSLTEKVFYERRREHCQKYMNALAEQLYLNLIEKKDNESEQVYRTLRAEKNLSRLRKQIHDLTNEIILAEEHERKRISIGLHDCVVQVLSALCVKTKTLDDMITDENTKVLLQSIREELRNVTKFLHELSFELSPPILHEFGLIAAIKWLGDQIQHRGISFEYIITQEMPEIEETSKILLFQCLRELMANTCKHSNASQVALKQDIQRGSIVLTLEDNGTGFDQTRIEDKAHDSCCFGLLSLKERIAQVGGRLDIASETGVGTKTTICVPLH